MSRLDDALESLRGFNTHLDAWRKSPEAGDMGTFLRMYVKVKDRYEALDEERKRTGAMLEEMNRTGIPDLLGAASVRTIALDDIGKRFSLSSRVSCSILDKPLGYGWLRKNGQGDIITETVNSSTLSAFAKSYVKDTGMDLPADIFKVSTMTITSVTKI